MLFNRRFGIYGYNESMRKEGGGCLIAATGSDVFAVGRRAASATLTIQPGIQAAGRVATTGAASLQAIPDIRAYAVRRTPGEKLFNVYTGVFTRPFRQAGGSGKLAASSFLSAEGYVFRWSGSTEPTTSWNDSGAPDSVWNPVTNSATQWRKVF